MRSAKSVILCADDFAQDDSTSAAILDLVDAGGLSAVSCFTEAPRWPIWGAQLRRRSTSIRVGLHFNLTQSFGHAQRPLLAWILGGLLGRTNAADVRGRLARQIDRFTRVMGRPPDYVDGHQHVHALPGISDVVASALHDMPELRNACVRLVTPCFGGTDARLKRALIEFLGRRGALAQVPAARAMNSAFGGCYSLHADADYAGLFETWLATAPDRALIMCHPRLDAGTAGRREFDFLGSPRCRALFAAHAVLLDGRGSGSWPGSDRVILAGSAV